MGEYSSESKTMPEDSRVRWPNGHFVTQTEFSELLDKCRAFERVLDMIWKKLGVKIEIDANILFMR
jgi:hypothetical protein